MLPNDYILTQLILGGPMVDWQDVTPAQMADIERQAAGIAERAARLSAYLSRRMSGGKHETAVKAQNETAAKVRAALGYTYKHAPIRF